MFLQPMTSLTPLTSLSQLKSGSIEPGGSDNQVPFVSLFNDAVNNLKETELNLQAETQKVIMGETDDLHSVNIASTKAGLALDVVLQLRNKALDSYNEIMRMGV